MVAREGAILQQVGGGIGWSCNSTTTAGGIGGVGLSTFISGYRFFMGGGGALNNERNQVDFKWSTASQENNDYFTIERSIDTKDWVELTIVDGAGTINQLLNYTSIEENPELGINYYRLKQTDYNGDFTYSKIIAITNNSNYKNSVYLYPNPIKDILSVVTTSSAIENIAIINSSGAIVRTEYFSEESVSVNVDLSTFPSGSYLINIVGKSFNTSNKIVLQH